MSGVRPIDHSRVPHVARMVATALEYAVLAACGAYLIAYVFVALARVRYPFDLEWMEGASVDHVQRLMTGQRIYVRPSLAFIPYLYPPFYYYVSAAVAHISGLGLVPLRLVSFASSLGCFGLLYRFVRRETGSWRAGFIAAGLFAATYRIGGTWFDLARVDSLFLVLTLGSLYLVRFGRATMSFAVGGVLMALAALTKQTGLLIAVPVLCYVMTVDWRKGLAFAGACAMVFGTATLALEASQRGWYLYYVFGLPARIQRVGVEAANFWQRDIFRAMPIGSAIAAGYGLTRIRRSPRPFMFHLVVVSALVGSAWISRLHSGAFVNVVIPAYACLAVAVALAVHEAPSRVRADRTSVVRIGMAILCLLQLIALRYSPSAQVPTRQDVELEERLLQLIEKVDGEVYLAQHGFFPTLVGKETHAQSWAIYDILRAGGVNRMPLAAEIHHAIATRRFRLIVLDRVDPWLEPELSQWYHPVGRVFDRDGLWTLTGYRTHPRWIFAPN